MVLLTIAAALAEPVPGVHLEHARQFQHNPPDRRSPTPHPPPPDAPSPTVTVYGYHAYWTGSPLDIDYSRLSHIAIFNVALSSDGSLTDTQRWTNVAGDVVPLAHAYGVSVHLCVTSFTDPVTNAVLSDPSRRATAISQLADLVDQFDADGVNVDVEGLDAAQKSNFVSFIEELSVAVDEIVIATPAVDWQGAYDYDQLAALSDGLFIMGYGYHYSGSNPGPNAPLYGGSPWGRYSLDWSVNDHLEFGAPADKIILGLPLYGREWPTDGPDVPGTATGSGVAVFMEDALDRVATQPPLFDDVTRTPYMLGDDWQLWYDDVSSLRERISYAVDRELQGVGFWALQYEGEDSGFWEMVSEETVLLEDDPLETDTGLDTPAENAPPIARAGQPIEANVGDIVVLNGSASRDPEGTPLTYQWRLLSGPVATALDDDQIVQPRATLPSIGEYVFELTVNDGQHGSAPDTVLVTASPLESGGGLGCVSLAEAGHAARLWLVGAMGLLWTRRRTDER